VVRRSDIAARLGGDEFGMILKYTGLDGGQRKIEQLRSLFSDIPLPSYNVSFSLAVGGATFPAEAATQEILVKLADDRMYEHKRKIKERLRKPSAATDKEATT
jgi:diguanylate cyclase (GGDEF)-like protein